MTVLQRKDWLFLQQTTLTLYSDQELVKSRVGAQRPFPRRDLRILYL